MDEEVLWASPPTIALDATISSDVRPLFQRELQAAIDTWNAVECARPVLVAAAAEEADVVVTLAALGAGDEGAMDTAATTELVLEDSSAGTAVVGATIYLNADLTFGAHPQSATSGGRDLRATLVHELGHVLSLSHVCSLSPSTCEPSHAGSTMHPLYAGAEQAYLSEDDREGLCFLYPVEPVAPEEPAPACDADASCDQGEWCIEGGCHREYRFGMECRSGSDCPAGRCVADGEAGVCTYDCQVTEDCPSQSACVPVTGSSARVCAPASGSGCSITGPRRTAPHAAVVLLALMMIWLRRRRAGGVLFDAHRALRVWPLRVWIPRALGLCAAVGLSATVAGCGDPSPVDAGARPDASDLDAEAGGNDAGAPEACFEPGAMRIGSCGFCGSQSQVCADEVWEPASECLGQGECAAASVDTEDLELCGQRQRICSNACEWGPWEDTRPVGECEPSTTRLVYDACGPGEFQRETCDPGTCTWTVTDACSNPCGGTPRTTPAYASEVCVPAGPFVRGTETYPDAQPVLEVMVDAFLIDRFPVTNDRFRECRDAGVCARLPLGRGYDSYQDPTRGDYPVQALTRDTAAQFCRWDGGRRLPTEAEWEKAARGPAPRTNPYPWEGTEFRCDHVPADWCEGVNLFRPLFAQDPYDGLPGTRSYYDTYLQMGGVWEIVNDWYDPTYYADPSSTVNPQGPLFGDEMWRGYMRAEAEAAELARRQTSTAGFPEFRDVPGFRCARSAP